jgi:hypothetical protein
VNPCSSEFGFRLFGPCSGSPAFLLKARLFGLTPYDAWSIGLPVATILLVARVRVRDDAHQLRVIRR